MVIPIEYDEEKRREIPKELESRLKEVDSRYNCVITVDVDYVAKKDEE